MIPRHLAATVRTHAREFKIVAVLGPRQSGKTTLMRALFADRPYVNLEEPDQRNFATADPRGFLARYPEGAVIDEAQRCPSLFSYLQGRVDATTRRGQFVLTGSQQFGLMETITQSLAGRVGMVELLPFSLAELREAGGAPATIEAALFRGGYPPLHGESPADPVRWLNAYLHTYVERDVRSALNVRDLPTFQRFLALCAGSAGQLLNTVRLGADCGVTHNTVRAWLGVLQAGYVVRLLQPHSANFRKRLVKTPKLYFCDPGLHVRLLGVETPAQLHSHPLRGSVFENWVIMELHKQRLNAGREPRGYFWRDNVGHEVDFLQEEAARLDAWEIKSGQTYTPDWADGLNYWARLAGRTAGKLRVVYGGDDSFKRQGIEVTAWRDLGR
ncbi:MAG: ATP-binding protein [Verrucomicrobia bacterium]|nr:ATP-binding protein [Verrucomicrobiota bacterium]